jgi:putative ABC transport system substrate-binding protein
LSITCEDLALSFKIEPLTYLVESEQAVAMERSINFLASTPNSGLVVVPDTTAVVHSDLLIKLAAQHLLPTLYFLGSFVAAGGLMSYGVDFGELFRQAASYVDGILRGDKPGDLPVQAATRFETSLNLRTAKALGLTVPPGLWPPTR